MGFLRQDTGDLPDPGIKPVFAALAGRFFTTEPPWKTCNKLGQDKSSTVLLLLLLLLLLLFYYFYLLAINYQNENI